jgi:hypothetical protein
MIAEGFGSDREISVDGLPMAEEGIVINRFNLPEEHGDLDTLLEVGLRAVIELRMGELMINLVPGHFGKLDTQ